MGEPLNYKKRLMKLLIPITPGAGPGVNPSVSIHNYQNTKLIYPDIGPANTQASELYNLYQADSSAGKPPLAGSADLVIGAVHQGVGSADQIANVLQLVAYYGEAGKFKHLKAGTPLDIGTRLQAYCEKYIGVDCVGFVLGFARDVKKSVIGYAGNYGTATFKAYKPAPVVEGSVLVWDDGDMSHIALIDRAPSNRTWIEIVESIGEGVPKRGLHEDSGTLMPIPGDSGHFQFVRTDVSIAKQSNRVMVVKLP